MASTVSNEVITQLTQVQLSEIMVIENQCHLAPWSEKLMASCLTGRYTAFGLYQDSVLVGFYVIEQAGPDFTLMDICVLPAQQGKGLAKRLLQHLVNLVKDFKGENVFLEVRESNVPARRLYQHCGFVESGLRKNYYPSASGREHAVLMSLALDND